MTTLEKGKLKRTIPTMQHMKRDNLEKVNSENEPFEKMTIWEITVLKRNNRKKGKF